MTMWPIPCLLNDSEITIFQLKHLKQEVLLRLCEQNYYLLTSLDVQEYFNTSIQVYRKVLALIYCSQLQLQYMDFHGLKILFLMNLVIQPWLVPKELQLSLNLICRILTYFQKLFFLRQVAQYHNLRGKLNLPDHQLLKIFHLMKSQLLLDHFVIFMNT